MPRTIKYVLHRCALYDPNTTTLTCKRLARFAGLRAIKSVLVQAGKFKRAEPNQSEGGLLMRALRDFNLPKIVADDMVVFMGKRHEHVSLHPIVK